MEKEKTKGRNFTQLKKAMSEEELRKFCKKIAEEYADSKGEYARSYFVKEYDISGSCFYKILETSIIKNWVSDETMLKMEEKAVENQKVHAETAGLSTRKHYSEMRQKRQEYIISFYTEKEIEDLATDFANSPLNKKEFAKQKGITSIRGLDLLLKKAIVEAIVDDIVFNDIRQRSVDNAKGDKQRVKEFFIQLAKERNDKISELLSE